MSTIILCPKPRPRRLPAVLLFAAGAFVGSPVQTAFDRRTAEVDDIFGQQRRRMVSPRPTRARH
jgi:hypothetical protein